MFGAANDFERGLGWGQQHILKCNYVSGDGSDEVHCIIKGFFFGDGFACGWTEDLTIE